jgi:hypothetical protein
MSTRYVGGLITKTPVTPTGGFRVYTVTATSTTSEVVTFI